MHLFCLFLLGVLSVVHGSDMPDSYELQNRILAARNNALPLTPALYQGLLKLEEKLPIEPYAAIISTLAPPPLSRASTVEPSDTDELGHKEALARQTNKDRQFTKKPYEYTILTAAILFGGGFLYFPFVANSSSWEKRWRILTSTLLVLYGSLAAFINLGVPAVVGASTSGALAVAACVMAYISAPLAWHIITFCADFLLMTLIYNITAFLFGTSYGLLGIIPGFLDLNHSLQKIAYGMMLAVGAGCLYGSQYIASEEGTFARGLKNCVSSYVSAALGVAQVMYGFALGGYVIDTPFEPIGFFDLPVKFKYLSIENITLLILLIVLGSAGFQYQQRRDELPLIMEGTREPLMPMGDVEEIPPTP